MLHIILKTVEYKQKNNTKCVPMDTNQTKTLECYSQLCNLTKKTKTVLTMFTLGIDLWNNSMHRLKTRLNNQAFFSMHTDFSTLDFDICPTFFPFFFILRNMLRVS